MKICTKEKGKPPAHYPSVKRGDVVKKSVAGYDSYWLVVWSEKVGDGPRLVGIHNGEHHTLTSLYGGTPPEIWKKVEGCFTPDE